VKTFPKQHNFLHEIKFACKKNIWLVSRVAKSFPNALLHFPHISGWSSSPSLVHRPQIRNSINAASDAGRASSIPLVTLSPLSIITADRGQASICSKSHTVLPGQSNGTAQLPLGHRNFSDSGRARLARSESSHAGPCIPHGGRFPFPRSQVVSQSPTSSPEQDESLSPTQTNCPRSLRVEQKRKLFPAQVLMRSCPPSVCIVPPSFPLLIQLPGCSNAHWRPLFRRRR